MAVRSQKQKKKVNQWATDDLPLVLHLKQQAAAKNKKEAIESSAYVLPNPHPGAQEAFLNTKASVCIYGGSAGGGKAQPAYAIAWAFENIPDFTVNKYSSISHLVPQKIKDNDSKVLMQNGLWKCFSSLSVGDRIMNPDGQTQEVLQVHERGFLPTFAVKFEDGTSVECGGDHLWGFWEVKDIQEINLEADNPTNWNANYFSRATVRDTRWLMSEMVSGKSFAIPIPRKVEAAKNHEPNIWVGKRIISVEETGTTTYCRCITVSSPNSLYITDGYNVTHNSFCLLLKAAKHIQNPHYGAVIFRRTAPEITNEGGLWDESLKIYKKIPGARSREGNLDWIFPSGAAISFGHAQYEKDVENKYPGAQIAHIGFDELTKFTEKQFWFLFSRNRSTSGITPRIDATCNPDADSWVAKLIDWWIDQNTGYPIPERGGVLRYFYRVNGVLHWGSSPEELEEQFPHLAEIAPPKSLTFIPAVLDDNKTLMECDPQYKANLLALHPVEMERLLKGNWKIKFSAGLVFNRRWFEIIEPEDVPTSPGGILVRFWDLASTAKEVATHASCYSASQKWLRIGDTFYILDCYWEQLGAEAGDDQITSLGILDGNNCKIRWELEGGSAARRHEASLIKKIHETLPKVDCKGVQPLGDKLARAKPWATLARAGQIKIVRAWWNDDFLAAADAFDGSKKQPPINDIIDSGSGAWSVANQTLVFSGAMGSNR